MKKRPVRSQHMGRRFRVIWEKPGTIMHDGLKCYGLTDPDRGTIRLENNMRPSKEREIFIHEILHQLIASGVLTWLDTEKEEQLAEFLGRHLGAHLDENPGLWRYLLSLSREEG